MARNRAAAMAKQAFVPQQQKHTLHRRLRLRPTRKHVLIGSISAFLLAFCAYRILTFIPQPLDSPSTMRPVLYALFTNFTRHYANFEKAQQSWANFSLVALFIPSILAFLNYLSEHSFIQLPALLLKLFRSRLLPFSSIAISLIVCRFPGLLLAQTNPDEPLFLAAAHKLFRDPVFFRAVDCGTTGPLNIYPLMLPALFGISPDYASARLVALSLIFASIYLLYRTFALLDDEAAARVANLPAAGAFALLRHRDFQHYSSEHVSVLLLGVALYLCVRIFRSPQFHTWGMTGLGLLTSAAFFAKMQAVPIIGCVALVAIAYIHWSGNARRLLRPVLLFGAGLASLFAVNAIVCSAAGVWNDFWMEYIVGNYGYLDSHETLAAEISQFTEFVLRTEDIRVLLVLLLATLAICAYQSARQEALADHALFLRMGVVGGTVAVSANALLRPGGNGLLTCAGVLSIAMLPGSFFLLNRNKDWRSAPLRWFGFLTAAVLASGTVAAYVPHKPAEHYLLLLVLPLTTAIAWPVVAGSPTPTGLERHKFETSPDPRAQCSLPFLLVFVTSILLFQLLLAGSPYFMTFADVTAAVRTPESDLITALTKPTEGIAVWGWNSSTYVGAGRITATKDVDIVRLFVGDPRSRAYYQSAYSKNLQRYPPALFIDAIETSFGGFLNRKEHGFEVIPEIESFVHSNYEHLLDAYGQRFYIRRDLAQRAAGIRARFEGVNRSYNLISKLSGKVLDVPGGAAAIGNGVLVQQSDYTGSPNQKWHLIRVDDRYCKIVSTLSGKVLDVVGGSGATGNGVPIQQWEYLGGANQQWELIPTDATYSRILSKLSGKAVTAQSGYAIQQSDYVGGPNQQWQLVPVQ